MSYYFKTQLSIVLAGGLTLFLILCIVFIVLINTGNLEF